MDKDNFMTNLVKELQKEMLFGVHKITVKGGDVFTLELKEGIIKGSMINIGIVGKNNFCVFIPPHHFLFDICDPKFDPMVVLKIVKLLEEWTKITNPLIYSMKGINEEEVENIEFTPKMKTLIKEIKKSGFQWYN